MRPAVAEALAGRDRFVHIGRLHTAAASRKPGVVEAYMKAGKTVQIRGVAFVQLSDADYQAIRKEFSLTPRVASAVKPLNTAPKPKIRAPIAQTRGQRLPGITAMAKNAAGAASRVITAAAKGQPIQVTDAEFARRMNICAGCEFMEKESQRCLKCACFLAAKVIGKARLATENCPLGKWGNKGP